MKNVVIFSDGTGQRGGLTFDERRSNIYKLFRATRCGPDSSVNPAEQVTFYDPGLGTLTADPGLGFWGVTARRIYNLASRATGLGLTGNIVDCYTAIVRLWQPGDHIFLFGFSRGAYTVRCLNTVLSMCGVPTTGKNGSPLRRDEKTAKRVASEAVRKVYQHTESRPFALATERQKEMLGQRAELAARFRQTYHSVNTSDPAKSNASSHFVGVFDTVASLANPVARLGFCILGAGALTVPSAILAYFGFGFLRSYLCLAVGLGVFALAIHTALRVRFELNLTRKKRWRMFHFTAPRMRFYDTELDANVRHARHAIAIDEFRPSFERVRWGSVALDKCPDCDFEQLWFAGDHSDIGGGYPENESRLSDVSLQWMLNAAIRANIKYDASVLKLYPDSTGPQHDETRSSFFRFFGKSQRAIPTEARLHSSVTERLQSDSILDCDEMRRYRPENLRNHTALTSYYSDSLHSDEKPMVGEV